MYYLKRLYVKLFSLFVLPIALTLAPFVVLLYRFGSVEVKVELITQRNYLLKYSPLWAEMTLITLQVIQYAIIYWLMKD